MVIAEVDYIFKSEKGCESEYILVIDLLLNKNSGNFSLDTIVLILFSDVFVVVRFSNTVVDVLAHIQLGITDSSE